MSDEAPTGKPDARPRAARNARDPEAPAEPAAIGFATRLRFLSMAELEAARATRYGLALSIALFAPEEPSVLRALPEHEQERLDWELGNRLASTIRQGPDVLARFALGEWALLLPHTGLDGAIAVAQRGLDRVNDPELRAGIQSPSRLAIAAGVASHQPVRRYGVETVGQLLQAAERAQRQSRALGGGRAVGWTCDVAPGPEPHA